MISLYAKIPKDFDFLVLSNFSRDLFIPLVCNFQSVLSAQAPMDMQLLQRHHVYLYILCKPTMSIHKLCRLLILPHSCTTCIFSWQPCLSIFVFIAWAAVSNPSDSVFNSPFFTTCTFLLLFLFSSCCYCYYHYCERCEPRSHFIIVVVVFVYCLVSIIEIYFSPFLSQLRMFPLDLTIDLHYQLLYHSAARCDQ